MRISITGADGMLGTDLVRLLSRHHEVIPLIYPEFEITNRQKVFETIMREKPQVIIHCAAYTDVDGCENNVEQATLINGVGTRNIAKACARTKSNLVYLSTDYVFDGTKGSPYLEKDPPNPISVYGKSKLAGEKWVAKYVRRSYIIRTQWLYGKNGRNFARTIINKSKDTKELKVVTDQFGSPTYTYDLAQAIEKLITLPNPKYGIYHLTNQGHCSWFDLAQKILQLIKAEDIKVSPISAEDSGRPAPRPKLSVLENQNWQRLGLPPLRPWEEALKAYLKEEKFI